MDPVGCYFGPSAPVVSVAAVGLVGAVRVNRAARMHALIRAVRVGGIDARAGTAESIGSAAIVRGTVIIRA